MVETAGASAEVSVPDRKSTLSLMIISRARRTASSALALLSRVINSSLWPSTPPLALRSATAISAPLLPRDHLQSLGDVLAQFAPPRATAAQANRRSRLDHPLARQMLGEGLARRTLAGKGHHIGGLGHGPLGSDLVLGRRTLELLECQF